MSCETMKAQLSAYMDGVLDETQARRVEEHLASCDACRSELIGLEELRDEVGSLTQVKAPADFKSALMDRISQSPPKGKVFSLHRRSVINLAASLAIVALTVYLIYIAQTQSPVRMIEDSAPDRSESKEVVSNDRSRKGFAGKGSKKGPAGGEPMDAVFEEKGIRQLKNEAVAEAPSTVREEEREGSPPKKELLAKDTGEDLVLYVKAEGWTFPPDLLEKVQSRGQLTDRIAREFLASRSKGPKGPPTPSARKDPEYEYVAFDADAVDFDDLVNALRRAEPNEIWGGTVVDAPVRLWPEEVGADDEAVRRASEIEALKALGYAREEEGKEQHDNSALGRIKLETARDADTAKGVRKRRIVVIFPKAAEKK